MKSIFLFVLVVILSTFEGPLCFSQSVGINPIGNLPNQTAGLDIDFPNKGVLVPRMAAAVRLAIVNPANALLVFDTDSNCFFFYKQSNTSWNSLCNGGSSGSTAFDPHFPDGSANLVGISVVVSMSQPYAVPAGKSLHLNSIRYKYPSTPAYLIVNGDTMFIGAGGYGHDCLLSVILKSGDVITANAIGSNQVTFSGYLVTPIVQPVIQRLNGNPYTVPAGKSLFINYIANKWSSINPDVGPMINGVRIGEGGYGGYGFGGGIPLIAQNGDVISTNNAISTILIGYLK